MASKLMNIKDFQSFIRWGTLVKSWAMGVNLFDARLPAPALPTTLEKFKEALRDHNIAAEFSPNAQGFAVMQPGDNTIVLKLPPRKLLADSHNELPPIDDTSGGSRGYDIPEFYNTAYGVPSLEVHGMSIADFHACRVGDYTLSFCG